MKKSIFTLFLFSSIIANAQFEKGDKYIGGNVGLGFSTSSFNQNSSVLTGTSNNFGISLNPQFFKAVKSNSNPSNLGLPDSTIVNLTTKLSTLVLMRDDLASRGAGSKNPLLINFEKQIKIIRDILSDNQNKTRKGYGESSNTLRGFTVGLNFGTSTGNQTQGAVYFKGVNNNIGASIGYAIRKYKSLTEKLFWYMEYNANIGYNYNWQRGTTTNPINNTKSDGMGYYVGIAALPALALKVDDRLLVDVNFGGLATGYNYSSSQGNHNHNFNVQLNLTSRFTLGILWKLKKSAHS